MKTADEYAELAVSELNHDEHDPLAFHAIGAQVYATLALAAATLTASGFLAYGAASTEAYTIWEERVRDLEAALRKAIPLLPDSDREWAEGALLTAAMQESEAYTKCPECGCMANVDYASDGTVAGPVCEEYPGCAELMESAE